MDIRERRYIMELTRDIVVSAISSTVSQNPDVKSGENIADMYSAIYNKLADIYQSDGLK